MSARTKGRATYADLEAVPPHLVAEIVYGSLEILHAISFSLDALFPFDKPAPGRDSPQD